MAEFRFPNESDEYRARRNELLELEKDLRDRIERVAQKRRELPNGGRLKQDYRFERLDTQGRVEEVAFADLFGEHRTLLLYTMMFGADWKAPCPSCTSLIDGYEAIHGPLSHRCAMAVVSAARPEQLREWADRRGWNSIPLFSAVENSYILDYAAHADARDPTRFPVMNVFRRTKDGVFHSWGSELVGHPTKDGNTRHVDMVWAYWNLLDMTPEGRGELAYPIPDFDLGDFSNRMDVLR